MPVSAGIPARIALEDGRTATGFAPGIALEDGWSALGRSTGAAGTGGGECVFNTCLSGYQEVLTDPSYAGQIVVMTYPLIGNYGIIEGDGESSQPQVAGYVMRECVRHPSNWQASHTLPDWLSQHGVVAIEGIDTRELTLHLRERGALRGGQALDAALLHALALQGHHLAAARLDRIEPCRGERRPEGVRGADGAAAPGPDRRARPGAGRLAQGAAARARPGAAGHVRLTARG